MMTTELHPTHRYCKSPPTPHPPNPNHSDHNPHTTDEIMKEATYNSGCVFSRTVLTEVRPISLSVPLSPSIDERNVDFDNYAAKPPPSGRIRMRRQGRTEEGELMN